MPIIRVSRPSNNRFASDYPNAALVLPLLCLAPSGIAEDDLMQLCGIRQAVWSALRLALEPYLFGGASVRLCSEGFRAAAQRKYLPTDAARGEGLRRLARYFESSHDDRLRALMLPPCYLALGDERALLTLLGEPRILAELRERSAYRLSGYVSAVQAKTGERLARLFEAREATVAAPAPREAFAVARCLLDAGESEMPERLLTALCKRFAADADGENEQLACGLLAHVRHKSGEYMRAEALYERKRELCGRSGNELELAKALSNLGVERWLTGNLNGAGETFRDARALCRRLGYADGEQIATGQLANLAYLAGDMAQAKALYAEQRRLCELSGNPFGLAAALGGLGLCALRAGQSEEALALFQHQAETCERSANPDGRQTALGNAALVYMRRKDYERAIPLLAEKLAICERCQNAQGLSTALFNLAQTRQAQGELAEASELAQRRVTLLRQRRMLEQLAGAQYQAALLRDALGDEEGARQGAPQAVAAASQCGQTEAIQQARELLARLPKATQ